MAIDPTNSQDTTKETTKLDAKKTHTAEETLELELEFLCEEGNEGTGDAKGRGSRKDRRGRGCCSSSGDGDGSNRDRQIRR